MLRQKVLLVIKLPPPVTGFTVVNEQVARSEVIKSKFDLKIINLNFHFSHNIPILKHLTQAIKFLYYNILLLQNLVLYKPDLVYFTISPVNQFNRDFSFVLLLKIFRKKIIYHLHGKGIKEVVKNSIKKNLYKFAYRNIEVICLSPLLAYDIEDIFKGKPFFVGNAILNKIKDYQIENRNRNPIPRILFLSNFILSKGIIDFIDALAILKSRGLEFSCILTGQEMDISYKEVNCLLVKKGLSNVVEITGPKYEEEKTKALIESDMLVFPTYYETETWGLVILEAMQASLPVISTNEGAIPEIIDDGVTGFIVEKRNIEAIAQKIEVLIKNKELRIRMGKAGRKKFLQKYTLDTFEKNMVHVFNEILAK
jgi:glycosyltransferase involved in cell wall biosynthesis